MRKIVFFGDSLTAGYGLANPADESVPGLIAELVRAEGYHYNIVNAGISGDTSSSGLNRLDYWLRDPVDIFVLELGVNDMIRGLPPSSTKMNLDNILKRVKQKHPLCKLAIMGMEIPDFITSKKIDEFRAIYRSLADTHQAVLVPFYLEGVAGVKTLNMKDGLHPNSKGYKVIAEQIWPTIKSLV